MTDDGHVNRILMVDFVRQNLPSYVGYILMVLLAFPLQYLYVPRALTKFVNHMQMKTWWVKSKPFLSLENAEGSAVYIVGAWVFIAVCFLIRESIARYIVPKHTVHVRQQIYKALLKRYEEEFQDIPTGNVITRLLINSFLYIWLTSNYSVSLYSIFKDFIIRNVCINCCSYIFIFRYKIISKVSCH